jgi:hypothetical protein
MSSPSPQRYAVTDALHQHMPAYSVALPPGWSAWSAVTWNLQHTAQPVTLHCVLRDPATLRAIEFWPLLSLFWIDPDLGLVAPNTPRFGQIALPPMLAADLLARWLLPQIRGRQPGYQLVDLRPSPELPARFGAAAFDPSTEGVTARVAYHDGATPMEEEFVAVKVLRTCPTTGPLGGATQINWGFERVASFRAPRGGLDPLRDLFWQVVDSVEINPGWAALAQSIQQQLNSQFQGQVMAQYAARQEAQQQHQAAMQHLHAAAQQGQQAFEQRMAAPAPGFADAGLDRNEAFRDVLGGERTYHDDSNLAQQSKHAAAFAYVFTDGQGHYQYSNDPLFDPNVNSAQTWALMREKK